MNICIFSAAMSAGSNGLFGTLDPEMGDSLKANQGIKSFLQIYKTLFRIPENTNHYSEKDYRAAERKFLKYALEKEALNLKKSFSKNEIF